MSSTPFTPYWRHIEETTEPYSWIFFVVAKIAGHHRPVAIVSSPGMSSDEETMRKSPLIAASHRVITIFSNATARIPVEAELALAKDYYGSQTCKPEPIDLPETTTRNPILPKRNWDHTVLREFPFISACLLQGVALDAVGGNAWDVYLKPLSTVYRDTLIGWGMAVIDITDLDRISYGIVGFSSAPMKFASSAEDRLRQIREGTGPMGFWLEGGGEFRVVDEVRPRIVKSSAEYLQTIEYEAHARPSHKIIGDLLTHVPLVDSDALEFIWPPAAEYDILPSLSELSMGSKPSLHEQEIRGLIIFHPVLTYYFAQQQSTMDVEKFDMSMFGDIRNIPHFQEMLQRNLLQNSAPLGNNRSASQLIRLAFADQDHLRLELLNNISVQALSAALEFSRLPGVISMSLCIESITEPSIELIDALESAVDLQEVHFLKKPDRGNDLLSGQLFEALATRPQLFSRIKFMFAGAYSTALRKRFWLPTIPERLPNDPTNAVQVAPLEIFPIQQIIVRHHIGNHYDMPKFDYKYVHVADGLLKPERFAAGFMIFLHSLDPTFQNYSYNPLAHLFAFSTAPSSLSDDPLTTAEISPILAENFTIDYDGWPRMRDLVPGGWTVIVSLDQHFKTTTRDLHYIRYAFVRSRREVIEVESAVLAPRRLDELEVVGLKEFLACTAPGIDLSLIDRRLSEVADNIASGWNHGNLPLEVEPLSVLSQATAVGMLLDFLEDAKKQNNHLRAMMKEDPEGKSTLTTASPFRINHINLGLKWYPELLKREP
ncbi:hypothetical protein IFR05_013997 [Cadophora sp. M221]|nr:hypothetical protein IFR05_013997 [Cadophora sp. M221]